MVTAGRHTEGMAATTITVSTELRDRLEVQAAALTPDCLDEIRRWVHDYLVD